MYLFGQNEYIGEVTDSSLYFIKQKNYLFGNPCTYNPLPLSSLDINVSECEAISDGIFK